NESVTGFDPSDIQLTRNGTSVSLQGTTLQGTGSSYTLGNLSTITYPVGQYVLQIKSTGTGIMDGAGNAFAGSNAVNWKMVGTDNTLISIRSPRKDGSMEIRDASTNQSLGTFTPFPGYSGAVHLVEGKFTGDGRRWVVMAAGEGGAPHIVMMDPSTGQVTRSWFGYSTFFRGGLFIAVGDVNGDGADDLVTGPNAGGGPHIKVYDGKTNQVIYEFMAYAPTFTGGVSVSLADVNGDGRLDIVTGTGKGGGPHVIAFDGMSGRQILSFMAYNPAFRGGVFVAAGDMNGDGYAEIVTGTGVGGGPHVGVFDSRTLQMT
ncbi:MAG: FG-GAP repeat domain-containing protein, partial [Planctomycetia bacterium]